MNFAQGMCLIVAAASTGCAGPQQLHRPAEADSSPCRTPLSTQTLYPTEAGNVFVCEPTHQVLERQAIDLPDPSVPPAVDPDRPLVAHWVEPSARSDWDNEHRMCFVLAHVTPDGSVNEVRLELGDNRPELNEACLGIVKGAHLQPAIKHGYPIDAWIGVGLIWNAGYIGRWRPSHEAHDLCVEPGENIATEIRDAPRNAEQYLNVLKLAIDDRFLLDPCFFTDNFVKKFFGATTASHHWYGPTEKGGSWSSESTFLEQILVSSNDAGDSFVGDINVKYSKYGVLHTEISFQNSLRFRKLDFDAVTRIFGPGERSYGELSDSGGMRMLGLGYKNSVGNQEMRALFTFDESGEEFESARIELFRESN